MRRAVLQREITAAVLPRLGEGEEVVGCAAVWVSTPRGTAQRIVSARRLLPAAITDQRFVLFRPPEKGTVDPSAIALEIPLAQLRLDGIGRVPLLQVRLRAGRSREIVVEFRPRDRWLGRELAQRVRGGAAKVPELAAPAVPAPATRPAPEPAPEALPRRRRRRPDV